MSALLPHQHAGAEWLAPRARAYLADPPGVGKTRTLLAGAVRAGVERITVLCPANARGVWFHEAQLLLPGLERRMEIESYDRVVANAARRRGLEAFAADLVILDEAHRLGVATSARTRLVLGREGLARRASRCWLASGTPFTKNPMQLFTMLAALWPDRLKAFGIDSRHAFLDRFCVWRDGEYGIRVFDVKNAAQLRALLYEGEHPVMLRRDVDLNIPELRWPDPYILEGAPPLDAVLASAGVSAEDEIGTAAYRRIIGIAKAPLVAGIVADQLENNDFEKVVVGAHHVDVMNTLAHELERFGVLRVDGSVTGVERDVRVARFQQDIDHRVFLASIEACKESITLTAAQHIALVEPAWNGQTNVQFVKRIHRYGQNLPTSAQMYAFNDDFDRALVRNHLREVRMFDEVL